MLKNEYRNIRDYCMKDINQSNIILLTRMVIAFWN